MKGQMISGFVAIALLTIATAMLWSHSPTASRAGGFAGASSQGLQTTTDVNKLPIEESDDQTMVFSKKRQ